MAGNLSKLPNIGPVVEQQLIQAGIDSAEQLRAIGAKAAWLKIQSFDSSACFHRLMALEGAVLGVKKNMIPQDRKRELKCFYEENKK